MTKRTDDIILSRIDELKDDIKVFRSDAGSPIVVDTENWFINSVLDFSC